MQAGRGGAEQAGGVGEFVCAVLRLDGERVAVRSADVSSPFPLSSEIPVVKHLLTVGI